MAVITFARDMPSEKEISSEAARLHDKLGSLGWSLEVCRAYAPLTLEINSLKKKRNAIVLAHSYQTPDIIWGVADFVGDSYALSDAARKTDAKIIVFAGVRFMAETAKLLNPKKRVFIPSLEAGCSLADDITAEDVRQLKRKHPGVPVVCYINTSADVKAESDVCCTSSNAAKIIRALPGRQIIFIPDEFMAKNLEKETGKKIISWHSRCVVHQDFDERKLAALREAFPSAKILVHSECPPAVVQKADLVGGTGDMERFVKSSDASSFVLVTECGLSDRLRFELPNKEFVGMCALCPYMKKNSLALILEVLQGLPQEKEIALPEEVAQRARRALEKMFGLSQS
ncbi:MAG: quinolinate synthase NadA [Candidatus Micrarchaeota archaeon]|nr:quinolinate synthase NadA [Candidatus Micrarchaeota archaeon]